MKTTRSFASSSSSGSLLLGFLDVISCGFAAALVLGLINSLVQPTDAAAGATQKRFRYFEFTVADHGADGSRAYLSPQIEYSLRRGPRQRANLRLDHDRWTVEGQSFAVHFVGAAAVEDRVLSQLQAASGTPATFGALVTEITPDMDVSIQLIYAARSDQDRYITSGDIPPAIDVARAVYGGATAQRPPPSSRVEFGDISRFPETPVR